MPHQDAHQAIRQEISQCLPLISALQEFAQTDPVYIPSIGNLGDGLIQLGTFELLDSLSIKPQYSVFDSASLAKKDFAVIGGGGGWYAGIWERHARLLRPFFERGGRALILPSTISGFTSYFEKYGGQITVFAREMVSYKKLSAIESLRGRVHFCHDLAFYTQVSSLLGSSAAQKMNGSSTENEISLFREDAESRSGQQQNNLDIAKLWNGDRWHSYEACLEALRPAAQFINLFSTVKTDRLHMTILATMLGKNVKMYQNSYYKNKAVYTASLKGFSNVELQKLNQKPTSQKPYLHQQLEHLSLLRREWFEPELQRLAAANNHLTDQLAHQKTIINNLRQQKSIADFSLSQQRERTLILTNLLNKKPEVRIPSQTPNHYLEFITRIDQSRIYRLTRSYSLSLLYYEAYQLPIIGSLLHYCRGRAAGFYRRLKY